MRQVLVNPKNIEKKGRVFFKIPLLLVQSISLPKSVPKEQYLIWPLSVSTPITSKIERHALVSVQFPIIVSRPILKEVKKTKKTLSLHYRKTIRSLGIIRLHGQLLKNLKEKQN